MNWKLIVALAGAGIVALAVVDLTGVQVDVPTSSPTLNLVIGGALIALPFAFKHYQKAI